jgi:hypothetical protein
MALRALGGEPTEPVVPSAAPPEIDQEPVERPSGSEAPPLGAKPEPTAALPRRPR